MSRDLNLEAALNFDPVAHAEELTGEYRTDRSSRLALAFTVQHSKTTEEMLKVRGDTHYNITFNDAAAIAEREGFKLLHTIHFNGTLDGSKEPATPEEFRIYWHPEHFALLTMESYRTTSLNMGKVYFAWEPTSTQHP